MRVFIKILKIIIGIILGFAFSFVTIVCLEILLPKPNPFRKEGLNLWLVGPIIVGWLLLMLWFVLRKPSPKPIQTKAFENLPASLSDLVDGIIHAMQYRKSVQAEVRQELTDHFTDALSDCENEQEKQKRIKELIEDFGNIELLGTLIRRGKKRCQPLWRKILTHIPHAIGIFFVLLILYIGWFFTGTPKVVTDYLAVFNQQVRPAVDESQNAWPYYEQAAKIYKKPKLFELETENLVINESQEDETSYQEDEIVELDTSPRPLDTVPHEEMRILKEWLTDNQPALELIRQGNQKPYYWRNYSAGENDSTELINVFIPDLSELRQLARLLCWEGMVAADKGNFHDAFDSLSECFILGHHIRGKNTTLIEQLVAISIEAISMNTYRTLFYKYLDQITPELLGQVRRQFQEMVDKENFAIDFECEKLFLYDEVQRCFTGSRFGGSHLFLPRLMSLGSSNIEDEEIGNAIRNGFHILFTHPDKAETLKTINTFYTKLEEMEKKTPATLYTQDIDLSSQAEKLVQGNLFLEMMTPAVSKVIELSYRNRIDAYATSTILAILQYYKEYAQYPDSLDELVQKNLLGHVPIDPFSNKPLVYRKTEDSFILYSVGRDFVDDGGEPATTNGNRRNLWGENGDWIFWPVQNEK